MDNAIADRIPVPLSLFLAVVLLASGPASAGEVLVPCAIEAEAFDPGGEGVAYHDTTPGNAFGACRTTEDVDIVALPGGGYAVGGIEDGEWLSYTIDGWVSNGGYPWPVDLVVASDRDGRSIQVEVNGTPVRTVDVPNTGSLSNFTPVLTQFGWTAGPCTLRLRFAGDGQRLDRLVVHDNHPDSWGDQWMTPPFSANRTNGTAPLSVQFTAAPSPWVHGWHWYFGDNSFSDQRDPVHTFRTPGSYLVVLRVDEEDHWYRYQGSLIWVHIWNDRAGAAARITVSAPVIAVPPGMFLPLDGDTDGLYEDVNGNGAADFADIVLYFQQMEWIAANEPLEAFDFSGNGAIDFADVIWLFTHL